MHVYQRSQPNYWVKDSFITRIQTVINSHLDEAEYRVNNLCTDLGVSRSQLHRKVKSLTGKSTTQFLRIIRLEKAVELLQHPQLQIAEIAYAVGFTDPCYFNRVFTRQYGITPGTYRNQISLFQPLTNQHHD
jgi:AraC-like DNA-binding protein